MAVANEDEDEADLLRNRAQEYLASPLDARDMLFQLEQNREEVQKRGSAAHETTRRREV